MDKDKLKKELSELQYKVAVEGATEPPFQNEFWDHKALGLYVDITSGEPLFSSFTKYDSGCGWPSFTESLPETTEYKEDLQFNRRRTEVLAKSGAHLGHVFEDGPKPLGVRYCINSASIKFIAYHDLEKEGYGGELRHFAQVETIILAGGCFWGVEELLRNRVGILETMVGYSGGHIANPEYKDVKTGTTGHAESIRVDFDRSLTSLEEILLFFFQMHDPTTVNRQGNDTGDQYRSEIFYFNDQQKQIASNIIKKVNELNVWSADIVTKLSKASEFYPAEEYHRDYLQKNPNGYTCHFVRDWEGK